MLFVKKWLQSLIYLVTTEWLPPATFRTNWYNKTEISMLMITPNSVFQIGYPIFFSFFGLWIMLSYFLALLPSADSLRVLRCKKFLFLMWRFFIWYSIRKPVIQVSRNAVNLQILKKIKPFFCKPSCSDKITGLWGLGGCYLLTLKNKLSQEDGSYPRVWFYHVL